MRRLTTVILTGGLVAIVALGAISMVLQHRLSASRLEERFTTALQQATDSVYRVHVGATSFSLLSGRFEATELSLEPDSARIEALRRAGKPHSTSYALRIGSLAIEGIGLLALTKGRLAIRQVTVDRFTVDAFLDRTGRVVPSPQRASLPPDWLAGVDRPLSIGTLRLSGGTINYGERAADGARPGGVSFDDFNATVDRITNRPAAATANRDTHIEIRALFMGASQLTISGDYDLTERAIDIAYRGELTRFDVTRLSPILVNLQGLRLAHGTFDGGRFVVDVKSDTATGRVTVRYHDLGTELVDKVSGKSGLKRKIETFIANNFVLRTDNPEHPDQPPKSEPVRLVRPASMPFFEFMWKTLRQGLLATLKDS